MGAAWFSEMFESHRITTQCQNPEDQHLTQLIAVSIQRITN